METSCTSTRTGQVQCEKRERERESRNRRTGHHEARYDQVEDVVELATLDADRERDVDVDFRTAVVLLLVPLGRHSFHTVSR